MVEFFSGPVATKLAGELLKVVAPRLRDRLVGSDEERALGRAFQRAFSAMLEEVAEPLSPEEANLLESQLHSFVTDPQVANALLDIAIKREKPPIDQLRVPFEELFDPETFSVDFDRAINSFAFQLTDELHTEAANGVCHGQAERFNRALAVLGLREIDKLLQALGEWAPSLEQVKPGLSVDVLREAAGIAGWVRSDWCKIHELLNS